MRKSVREGYVKHTWYPSREHELWIRDTWFRYRRQGIPIDVSSVVRAILHLAREEAEKNPDLILRWAEEASFEDRQDPTRLSALVEAGGDEILWRVRAAMIREYGSARKLSDALDAVIRHVRSLAERDPRRFAEAILRATPSEDGRGKRRGLPEELPLLSNPG